ncbi:MAG: hypothetical protein Edafosvirus4_47 [Edafosvirus sp.]|uniref:Uncharacterized protein n=1 Tax=Edafosvirus sp. TaxID=2487765 RepID=A0A3G4ZWT7_9VIRU|nr:MAG: hypothetical protein Edafosvirus4_47 [Edafosvirus sp.]
MSTDTHYYDGKLKEQVKIIIEKISDCDKPLNEIIQNIVELSQNLKYNRHNEVVRSLQLFMNDKRNNYDSTNDITIEQLLPKLWCHIEKWDDGAKKIFLEQIADINHGSCSQGRNTRLIQLFLL